MKSKKAQTELIFWGLSALFILGGIALILHAAPVPGNHERIVIGAIAITIGGLFGKWAMG